MNNAAWPSHHQPSIDRLVSLTPDHIPVGLVFGDHSGRTRVDFPYVLLASLRADLARGPDSAQGVAAMGRLEALIKALDMENNK